MKNRLLTAVVMAAMIACVFLQSCEDSTGPETEDLVSFDITAPATVTVGEPFTLKVTAVGNRGTKPYTSFDGTVVLRASDGILSPDSLKLTGGTGSGSFVLSGSSNQQKITATHSGTQGSIVVNADLMTTLGGNPGDPANEAIPGFEFFAIAGDYSDSHPNLGPILVSYNTIMVAFELGTTVDEANAILTGMDAKIVGGITGDDAVAPGVLFLKLPTPNHTAMENALLTIRTTPQIQTVVQDVLVRVNAIPKDNDGDPSDWTWGTTPGGHNWGLEQIRVPQMWNFNDAVAKKMEIEQMPPSTALIIDEGFVRNHPDVQVFSTDPLDEDPHGTHVAGTIGAQFDNGKGVDGICPFVFMIGMPVAGVGAGTVADIASAGQAMISSLYYGLAAAPYTDVFNVSLGYGWGAAGIDADNNFAAQNVCSQQAQLLVNTLNLASATYRTPLIVASAGNDSNQGFRGQDARYNSPLCFAAIELGVENIIVVEAIQNIGGAPTGWPNSSNGGHVSAPGADIWSTVSNGASYGARDGTSMAAAHVTGLVAYLYALEPYLTFWDVRDLLLSNTVAVSGAQPYVDAWASVVDIDRVRGGADVLEMMCDIDDGTPDGNQRVEYEHWADYYEEDADGDDGIGDGTIDMSDFRRWRDWFLQVTSTAAELDGAPDHPKKDVNKNSEVESPADENIYPRGDFNGDGRLDEFLTAFVPGAIGATMTDLGVLQEVFDDPDYESWELPDLLNSVDIEVDATRLFDSYATVTVEILKMPESLVAKTRVLTPGEPRFVFTMPVVQTGYKVEVIAGSEEYEHGDITYPDEVGRDYMFRPITFIDLDPRVTYLHICDDPDAQAAMIVRLADLGIKPGDVLCFDAEGRFGTGDDSGVEERAMGVFSSSDVLGAAGNSHRVPGAIDAGTDYVTAPTWHCGEEATDIPQDFLVYDTIIRVPSGATHLFLSALDRKFGDNSDSNGDYGVQISIVRVPDFLVD